MTPRTSLTTIVKNEADTLATCLDSVQDLVDEIIVVDTGSRDHSREVALQHGAHVFDFPWTDSFAAARNESLRHASGQWLLWLDADESFDPANRDKLRHLLANLSDDNAAYVMRQRSSAANGSATLVGQVRLFRNHPDLHWDYRVHEQILPALRKTGHTIRDTDLAIEHSGYLDPALRHKKLERNLRLLHLDHADRPNDPFTLFNLGWAYADLGRCADALPLLQHSLRYSHPADSITPKLYVLLSQCHRRLGQHTEAWAACQAGHVRCPDDAELLFLKGQLCHERGDRAAARTCWIQLLPNTAATPALPSPDGVFTSVDAGLRGPLVRHHLAMLAREQGQHADAEFHWKAAIAESPTYPPARLGLAELYLRQARWTELEQQLTELEPDPAAALESRRAARSRSLGTPRVRHGPDTARRGHPPDAAHPDALCHPQPRLATSRRRERRRTAVAPHRRVGPGQAESWRNLAVLLRRRQRMPEAIAAARAGCLHCPRDADLLLLHGVLLHEGGDCINAEACFLHVLEMDTNAIGKQRKVARDNLAAIYHKLGRMREAEAHGRALLTEDAEYNAERVAVGAS